MKIIHDMKPTKGPYLSIQEAEYVDGYRLRLTFNNGRSRIVDFSDYLRDAPTPWMTKYRNLRTFKKFRLLFGRLMWGDFDLIFPVSDLYRGKIEYYRPNLEAMFGTQSKGKSLTQDSVSTKVEPVPVPIPTLRRLKARAKKEDVPLELLMQRYLEEGMKRESSRGNRN